MALYRFYPNPGMMASHTVALSMDSFLEVVPKAQEVEEALQNVSFGKGFLIPSPV